MDQIVLGWILVMYFTGGRVDHIQYKSKEECLVVARQNIGQDDGYGHKIAIAVCSEGYSVSGR